eukprot:201841-Pyramimonas_sp.AAC.1
MEGAVKRLRMQMFRWQVDEGVKPDERIGDLTISVLGGEPDDGDFVDGVHAGGTMKFKAHETLVMCRFAVFIIDQYRDIPDWAKLKGCGYRLLEWYDSLKQLPFNVPGVHLPKLHTLMYEALILADEARLHHVPKFHFAGHLVQRSLVASRGMNS